MGQLTYGPLIIVCYLLIQIFSYGQLGDGNLLPKLQAGDLFNLRTGNQQQQHHHASLSFAPTCGYGSCPPTNPDKMNIHIVAHTHDDVGWLKTVDQYYYGTRKRNSPVGVQHILDSVIPQLVMDESKRFIYVEMSFFTKWWHEQDETMKDIVHRLVNEGRLEFINGGWCMNDEAAVTYYSTIEQMTLGLKFLNETFGQCGHPKVGWQIDPFGHTNEQASLFAQFGFDGMFFTRISYEDKQARILNKTLDLMWHADRILEGQSGSIFTNIFKDGYDAPNGFCFDTMCQDDNLVDNKQSYEYNIERKGAQFVDYLKYYKRAKNVNHMLVPMGGDFQFSAAGQNFKNLDKLIKYVKTAAPEFNIFYSTPSCYQYAVHQELSRTQKRIPEKYDDFMPYDSTPSVWWSGYFTSRPSVKLVEREIANLLQVTRVISMANLLAKSTVGRKWTDEVRDHEAKCLLPLWEVLGDLQHHDAVTGTERQHVADDYVRRASDVSALCTKFIGELRRAKLNDFLKKSVTKYEHLRETGKRFKLDPVFLEDTMLCPLLNISQCEAIEAEVDMRTYLASLSKNSNTQTAHDSMRRVRRTQATHNYGHHKSSQEVFSELQTKSTLMNVYNPLARHIVQHDIRLPCNGGCELDKVRVVHLSTNETMKLIRLPIPAGVGSLPFRHAFTNYEILFYANIPPLGYSSFVIEDSNNDEIVDEEIDPDDSLIISDDNYDHIRSSGGSGSNKNAVRSRRIKRLNDGDQTTGATSNKMANEPIERYDYFTMAAQPEELDPEEAEKPSGRVRRDSSLSQQGAADRVIVKFDLHSGMIVGLKRVSDGSFLNITQKFGYYLPAEGINPPGAYIFRSNSIEPHMLDKPIIYKMYKRKNGALIEIHQKWSDWLWQTIRVDAKKNYIEFVYLVGPVPITTGDVGGELIGREVVTRYITNLPNNGVFLTDSNARQLLPRHRLRSTEPEDLGGSFYPVVSTIMLRTANTTKCTQKCSAEAVAVLVDRAQAGTSLHDGQLELLVHRRHTADDHFGVGEALNEPGEDGRGLVTRGKHRLYLKFPDNQLQEASTDRAKRRRPQIHKLPQTPKFNLDFERNLYSGNNLDRYTARVSDISNYVVHDPIYNDLKQESRRFKMKPILTFDRLRMSSSEFIEMIAPDGSAKVRTDLTLLNTSLPNNIHLLTLQPWSSKPNEVLIRLENLNNPVTIHPFPDYGAYQTLLNSYLPSSDYHEPDANDVCNDKLRPKTDANIEYLIKRIRFVSVEELNLGANVRLKDDKRLDWTEEGSLDASCDPEPTPTSIKLGPRQIRTFLARFEVLQQ